MGCIWQHGCKLRILVLTSQMLTILRVNIMSKCRYKPKNTWSYSKMKPISLTKAGSYTLFEWITSCNQLKNNVTTFNNAAHAPINNIKACKVALKKLIGSLSETSQNEHKQYHKVRIDTINRLLNQLLEDVTTILKSFEQWPTSRWRWPLARYDHWSIN